MPLIIGTDMAVAIAPAATNFLPTALIFCPIFLATVVPALRPAVVAAGFIAAVILADMPLADGTIWTYA